MQVLPPERIERIESKKSLPHPEEILVMAEGYKMPDLTNYYCANECPIADDNVFITNNNEIYSIGEDGDAYTIVARPELSQLLQEGKIVKSIGDGFHTLFLMDDGCVYQKSSF